ncbi:hypothetical protein RQP46_005605 [Phenoliferia psychrophenolica]
MGRSTVLATVATSLLVVSSGTVGVVAAGKANSWAIVGETGASAQQMFLGAVDKVYIVDKTENNPATVGGHPAWATEYDLTTNTYRALDVSTNSFCAGGNLMGNGSWLNVGGNQAVTTGGNSDVQENITAATTNSGAYDDLNGGRATRVITPCSDETCNWSEDVDGIPINRWYPTLETLEDGSVIVIGGEMYGGFVNSVNQRQSVPTYEFWPTKGASINSSFLADTQPANLYPLTWLLPSGLIFMQANWQTTLFNYTSAVETRLPNITHAQKTYPATGSIAMLPLTVANNYDPTLLFCGGMDPVRDDWDGTKWAISETDTSNSCVSINPMDDSPAWVDDDDLPENRGMGNFIILPDERLFLSNGVAKGSAGYGWDSWAINQSYAQDPVLSPAYYTPSAAKGSRFDTDLPASTIGRLYHSSSTLLPDGSVFVAGSNPNADMIDDTNNATYVYKTEYRAEIFYPDYYDSGRPVPSGIPSKITYGGSPFDLSLPKSSLNSTDLSTIKVALIRTGFSTHGMNMGMRFVTVNGIPSIASFVMVGSGAIETQPMLAASVLPTSTGNFKTSSASSSASGAKATGGASGSSGAEGVRAGVWGIAAMLFAGLVAVV